ncbi:MAG: multiheme c-type cytochrome [Candidatus Krumholzibacteriia bacterium]
MARKWMIVSLVSVLVLSLSAAAFAQAPAHKIVGSEKGCKMCHNSPAKGAQFKVWSESNHAKAFAVLATPAALEAGKKLGVTEPQKDPKCLECHTTKAFLKVEADAGYVEAEGVGCEACHGAGSDYKAMAVMKDKAKAMAAGLAMPDAKTCVKCHNEKSPTFKAFDFTAAWKVIAHPYPAKTAG